MLLAGKSALVTGAANRIGAQIARTLHENGANLIIHYRQSQAAALSLCDELNGLRSDSAIALRAELGNPDELDELAHRTIAANGRLDLLVNNASSFFPTPFGQIDSRQWQELVSSNFQAPLLLSQACYPALRDSRGSIVNLLDIYASQPLKQHSVYCCAKAANRMLVKSLALELAPEVRVNGIAPGAILWPGNDSDDVDASQAILERVPLGRRGEPANIASTVMFLVANDYITGEIIRVDGGRLLQDF